MLDFSSRLLGGCSESLVVGSSVASVARVRALQISREEDSLGLDIPMTSPEGNEQVCQAPNFLGNDLYGPTKTHCLNLRRRSSSLGISCRFGFQ